METPVPWKLQLCRNSNSMETPIPRKFQSIIIYQFKENHNQWKIENPFPWKFQFHENSNSMENSDTLSR